MTASIRGNITVFFVYPIEIRRSLPCILRYSHWLADYLDLRSTVRFVLQWAYHWTTLIWFAVLDMLIYADML